MPVERSPCKLIFASLGKSIADLRASADFPATVSRCILSAQNYFVLVCPILRDAELFCTTYEINRIYSQSAALWIVRGRS